MQRNVMESLERTAAACGDKAAFIDERETITFAQLRQRGMALGTYLAARTDGVNAPVAVLVDRTADSIAAMQGVLTGAMEIWKCLVSFGLNLVYTALLVFVIARLLSSERVMFGK